MGPAAAKSPPGNHRVQQLYVPDSGSERSRLGGDRGEHHDRRPICDRPGEPLHRLEGDDGLRRRDPAGSELTWSDADGLLPSFVQLGWTGSAWTNQTITEARTGFDPNPNRPDAGLTIYLADDGTIKNYGAPVWFDPNPGFEVNPAVPAGSHDFVSILTHEIFHSLGFINYTQEWAARMVAAGDITYFTGPQSDFLYGGAIPFRTGYDHYGYAQDPSIPIKGGLMYEFGNYQQNRWEIGRIDLAVLADLGHTIKTYDGLPLFELIATRRPISPAPGPTSRSTATIIPTSSPASAATTGSKPARATTS